MPSGCSLASDRCAALPSFLRSTGWLAGWRSIELSAPPASQPGQPARPELASESGGEREVGLSAETTWISIYRPSASSKPLDLHPASPEAARVLAALEASRSLWSVPLGPKLASVWAWRKLVSISTKAHQKVPPTTGCSSPSQRSPREASHRIASHCIASQRAHNSQGV